MSKKILILFLLIAMALPAAAQFHMGVRGGITLNKMRFDRDIINSDNRMGYTAGLVFDLGIPVVGLGIEASLMYTRRNNRLTDHEHVFKRHYFEIPLYARYRLELPSVSRVFAPYIFTGPSFAILFDNSSSDLYSNRKTYISWDAGLGMDLFQHVRISASYGLGITKALKYVNKEYEGNTVNGKDKFWTVSAAYLF